jgi:subtilase family serine protease
MSGGQASAAGARFVSGQGQSLPSLYVATQEATDLGPVPAAMIVHFTLTLKIRNSTALQSVLASGGQVSPATWNVTYGPDAAGVDATLKALSRAGLKGQWAPGDQVLSVTGPSADAERFLHLDLRRFVFDGHTRFYAPRTAPVVPASISGQVVAVAGLDDYPGGIVAAIPTADAGVTPDLITKFYDMTPLRKAGFNGSGMTVIFPEYAIPAVSVLDKYASKFGLPPFDVAVHTDAAAWGEPGPSNGELADEGAMDLEIVHGLAPDAKEIVYEGGDSDLPQMFQTMFQQNPGAVMSSSITGGGWCESDPDARSFSIAANTVFEQAAAEGFSIYWASGDRGAYACTQDGEPAIQDQLSIWTGSDSPYVTAVGGSTIFAASNGGYYKEAAWGEPFESWGGGGGTSAFFPQPSYQVAPGLAAGSLKGRGTPDVVCNADEVSGWDLFIPTSQGPEEVAGGGTSAAAPCWAAITVLIDEDLKSQGLSEVGFANPPLYAFSRDPVGMPVEPFHHVTSGSNLHFLATAGWNSATGLGSPDVAHLADDFEWYERAKG